MIIGLCTIDVQIPAAVSLKDKRQILRSVTTQIRQDFNVSIAEVDHQDSWQLATLGVAAVSNDLRFLQRLLSRVVSRIESRPAELILLDYETEFL
jgi:hypothetical protein